MKKVVITLFALYLILLLVGQEKTGQIIGKVVDTDGNPIPGVTVTLLAIIGAPIQAITMAEGTFRFLALPPSKGYALKAELDGFKTKTESGIVVAVGETTEMTLVMEMEELLGEVTVILSHPPHGGLHKQMELTEEQIDALRSVKTVRIVAEQSYKDNRDRDLKNVRLPIEYVAGKFLKFIGLQVLNSDASNFDLEIKIITKGTANVFYGKLSPPIALITSEIFFLVDKVPVYSATIYNYSSVYRHDLLETISEPIKASRNPFSVSELAHELMSFFEGDIVELMGEIFGISPVQACLNDKNVAVRKYAAASLRHIRDHRTVELLIACTEDENKDIRAIALESLARIDNPQAVECLIEALKHEDEAVRAAAIQSLGNFERDLSLNPLIAAIKDEDKGVRVAAVKSLAYHVYMKDSRVIESLKSALEDEDKDVRAAALKALIRELDDKEEDILIAALTDKAGVVRATVLERIFYWLEDDKRAVEYSLAALTAKNGLVRAAAVKSLNFYRGDDPRVMKSLIAALNDEDEDVRVAAVLSLSEFDKDPRVANSLIGALNVGSELVRAAAAEALGYLDDDSQVSESLIGALNDRSELVRATVLEALCYSDNPRVVESLIAALKSKDENFRMYIDETLETITSESFDGNQKKWQEWWKINKEKFIKKELNL